MNKILIAACASVIVVGAALTDMAVAKHGDKGFWRKAGHHGGHGGHGGGGGHSGHGSGSATPAPPTTSDAARVEPDPISYGPSCSTPMRLENLRNYPVTVIVAQTWNQSGDQFHCHVKEETEDKPYPVGTGDNRFTRLGCTDNPNVANICTDHYVWKYKTAYARVTTPATTVKIMPSAPHKH